MSLCTLSLAQERLSLLHNRFEVSSIDWESVPTSQKVIVLGLSHSGKTSYLRSLNSDLTSHISQFRGPVPLEVRVGLSIVRRNSSSSPQTDGVSVLEINSQFPIEFWEKRIVDASLIICMVDASVQPLSNFTAKLSDSLGLLQSLSDLDLAVPIVMMLTKTDAICEADLDARLAQVELIQSHCGFVAVVTSSVVAKDVFEPFAVSVLQTYRKIKRRKPSYSVDKSMYFTGFSS